jgi:hypothetical protein
MRQLDDGCTLGVSTEVLDGIHLTQLFICVPEHLLTLSGFAHETFAQVVL